MYAHIRAAIMSGDYPPGSQHSVYRVAEDLGVSRTPVREAVLRLADAGLVSVERNRGFTIRRATLRDIREIFEYRIIIEVPAASYAASHADASVLARLRDELVAMREAADSGAEAALTDSCMHEAIMEVMGNPRMSATLAELRDATKLRWFSEVGPSRSLAEIEREHRPIVEAIERRDPSAAAAAMEEHLVRSGMRIQERIVGDSAVFGWQRRFHDHVRVGGSQP
ncbi:GntR family transcriptional regulator [Mycobacterium sp. NAZ190054]|uniref:GntR family transcriptional regulator n=1 Tax=Mycobacterium sp. NAZ190054 TaxID=1747766 RepID=UPI0021015C86|nr:GntR family transcriptional regulator [Mycobacterium sp. NAZ190054]